MTKTIRWVIAHEPVDLFLKVAEHFNREVNEATGGAFEIEVLSLTDYSNKYNHGCKITKNDLMNLIDTGAIDMSHIYTTWLADYNKDLHALDLPFLFRDHDHADKVLEGDIGMELLAGVAKQSNIKGLSFTYSGGYRIVPANFKADTVDAWNGRKVRTSRSPVAVETFKLLGAKPIETIALEEMNDAALAGRIEAGESTYVRVLPLEQYKAFDYVNDTAHSLFLTSIIVNQGFFASLDSETQEIMMTAAQNAARMERKELVADIPRLRAEFKARGIEEIALEGVELQKFKETVEPVYDKFKYYFTPGLVNRIKETIG